MKLCKLALGIILAIASNTVNQPTALSFNRPILSPIFIAQSTKPTRFTVRIENISTKDEFTASNGAKWTLDFSPGVWLVGNSNSPLFTVGQKDRGQGIEAIAEDGNPSNLAKSLQNQQGIKSSGVFNTAVGAAKAGGIRPGQAFEFTVMATPGQKLSLVTMFGQSNDWFYAPQSAIDLFDANGQPIQGDVTAQIGLWNAGTEVDEEPGIGATQGSRQKSPNTGVDENGVVQAVQSQAAYAQTNRLMRVTITPAR
jgi:Spondin_N